MNGSEGAVKPFVGLSSAFINIDLRSALFPRAEVVECALGSG